MAATPSLLLFMILAPASYMMVKHCHLDFYFKILSSPLLRKPGSLTISPIRSSLWTPTPGLVKDPDASLRSSFLVALENVVQSGPFYGT